MCESELVHEQLDQIGQGGLGFASAQRLAAAALRDGLCSRGVQSFASLGGHGSEMSHVERDAHRWLRDFGNYGLQLYSIKLNLSSDEGVKEIAVPVLSVHQMLSAIWHSGDRTRLVSLLGPKGVGELTAFWEQAKCVEWGRDHPARAGDIDKTIPLVSIAAGLRLREREVHLDAHYIF